MLYIPSMISDYRLLMLDQHTQRAEYITYQVTAIIINTIKLAQSRAHTN